MEQGRWNKGDGTTLWRMGSRGLGDTRCTRGSAARGVCGRDNTAVVPVKMRRVCTAVCAHGGSATEGCARRLPRSARCSRRVARLRPRQWARAPAGARPCGIQRDLRDAHGTPAGQCARWLGLCGSAGAAAAQPRRYHWATARTARARRGRSRAPRVCPEIDMDVRWCVCVFRSARRVRTQKMGRLQDRPVQIGRAHV